MTWDIITKQAGRDHPGPNLRDYAAARAAFTWDAVRAELAMPSGLNIAYWALDRHVVEGRGDKLALRWLGKNDERRDLTYRELSGLSNRFANLLRDMGIRGIIAPRAQAAIHRCRRCLEPNTGERDASCFGDCGEGLALRRLQRYGINDHRISCGQHICSLPAQRLIDAA